MQLELHDENDLIHIVSQLVSGAEDKDIFINYVWNPKRAIELGLWPHPFAVDEVMADWLAGSSYSEINFWHDMADWESTVRSMQQPRTWSWKTLETWKKEALASAISLPLLLYAPELVYTGSRRPKTDMSLFRSPLSRTIRRSDIRNDQVTIDADVWNVIPVARYASGMSRGLFYKDQPRDTCGTFYYLEPESTTYLAYRTELRAFNKTEAAIALDIFDEDASDIEDIILKHSRGTYPRDLILTPEQAYAIFPYEPIPDQASEQLRYPRTKLQSRYVGVGSRPHYSGVYLELYAEEDVWDQPLCIGARDAGYDIVVLESMIGRYQVVSEVLDTRSREDSFASLLYVVEQPSNKAMEISGQYRIGSVQDGQVITLANGVRATIRSQFDQGIDLIVEDLIVRVRSSDTESDCSLFVSEGKYYNIRGHRCSSNEEGKYLFYLIGTTDPETSPCRGKCMQRDVGTRLDQESQTIRTVTIDRQLQSRTKLIDLLLDLEASLI